MARRYVDAARYRVLAPGRRPLRSADLGGLQARLLLEPAVQSRRHAQRERAQRGAAATGADRLQDGVSSCDQCLPVAEAAGATGRHPVQPAGANTPAATVAGSVDIRE